MIESIDDFKRRLSEVDTLVSYARVNAKVVEKYKLFNKTAIIMLCSHFEVFVEAFISEHVDVLKKCYQSDNLPQYMKDNYINDTIKGLKYVAIPSRKMRPLRALFRLHDSISSDMTVIGDLELDMKYALGKHGQEETEKLFKKFGFEAFVNSSSFQDPFRKMNSAINIRNSIIHEGSSPSLTHADVIFFKQVFLRFANELEKYVLTNQMALYSQVYYAQ